MANLNITAAKTSVENTVAAKRGVATVTADKVAMGRSSDSNGEDLFSQWPNKLEASGVLASGTANPVFANETALFYYNTTSKTLFVRDSSSYEALPTEGNIISAGTTTPVPDADTSWIVLRTDTPKRFFLKERTGSPGSYSYQLQGPFFAGSYESRIIYSAADSPATPNVTWNWENANFNITGGDWGLDTPNAKWYRIVILPNDSDTEQLSPLIRIGDPAASDISYSNSAYPAVNNVEEGLNTALTRTSTVTPGARSLIQAEEYNNLSGALRSVGSNVRQNFSIDTELRNYRNNFSAPIFAEANATITLQQGAQVNERITVRFAILSVANGGTLTNVDGLTRTQTFDASISSTVTRTIRIAGNLPSSIAADGILEVRTITDNGAVAGVNRIRLELRPDLKSDEIIINNSDLGNNLLGTAITDLDDVLEQVDDFAIQASDFEDFAWPTSSNAIDDDGMEVSRTVPLHRFIQDVNNRPGHAYTAKISYDASLVTGSRIDRGTNITFAHRVYTDVAPTVAVSEQTTITVSTTPTTQSIEASIPANATEVRIGITNAANQSDAKLLIENYRIDIQEGIDSSGFSGNLTDNVRSTQSLANAVDGLTITASATAATTSVDNTQFLDQDQAEGGYLTNTGITGIPVNPTNVQELAVKGDTLFQLLANPFIANQTLDFGAMFANDGTVNSGTPLLSNPIDIPQELRDLGVDVTIRLRIRINAITNDFRGNFRLVNDGNTVTYGDPETANGGGVGARSAGDFVTFQRTIIASQVPNTFRVRYTRTSSAGSATINRSIAFMLDRTTDTTGQTGQTANRTTVIIWRAGLTTTSRLTEPSGTTLHTLLGSNTWTTYDDLEFHFDTSAAVGLGTPVRVDASWFDIQDTGMPYFTDDDAVLVTPVGTNQFRFQWNPLRGVGLREILGINYD